MKLIILFLLGAVAGSFATRSILNSGKQNIEQFIAVPKINEPPKVKPVFKYCPELGFEIAAPATDGNVYIVGGKSGNIRTEHFWPDSPTICNWKRHLVEDPWEDEFFYLVRHDTAISENTPPVIPSRSLK